jgi:hypothetical protein
MKPGLEEAFNFLVRRHCTSLWMMQDMLIPTSNDNDTELKRSDYFVFAYGVTRV